MSDDYWSSPDAAYSMAIVGKQAGLREGQQQGFEQGRNQGFHEGAAEMQRRMEVTIAQLRAERDALLELANGAVITLAAATDVLETTGDEKQIADFIVSYGQRVERSLNQKQISLPPHADERFTARLPRISKIIRDVLARYRPDDTPSP
jgi:flagellar biosynthesis/type III secretory pathway protein FliH